MKTFKSILIITSAAFILAGCSFEDIFAKLATSDVEAGAREEYQQAKAAEAKMDLINQKKQQFTETVQLQNIAENTKFVAFAYRKHDGPTTYIDIEAMLTNPGKHVYEVWLRKRDGKEKVRLGAMEYNQTDDYSFSYQTDKSLIGFDTVTISRESQPDETQETIVMAGAFSGTNTASESAVVKN